METPIKAIIIDDEEHCRETLELLLTRHCPEVEITAFCETGAEGLAAIEQHQPRVVFLDIEMPRMNGFEMLSQIENINFDVIFTTAYDEFAIKAIKFSALDYLMKPIHKDELKTAIEKVKQIPKHDALQEQFKLLFSQVKQPSQPLPKIALPTFEGLEFVEAGSIIHCQADNNYTEVFFSNRDKMLVSKSLKEVADLLRDHNFFRIHHSHLVNLGRIKKYVRGEGGYVVMENNDSLNVARSKKQEFLERLS